VSGIIGAQVISSAYWHGNTTFENNTSLRIVGVSNISNVSPFHEGLTVTSGASSLGVNETYVWVGSKSVDKIELNSTISLNFTFAYWVGDTWHFLNKRYTNYEYCLWDWVLVPTDASEIGFQFYSDSDNTIDLGVFLDNIGIRGKLHNDAPYQHTDAQSFANPNTITVGQTWTNYAGYLGALNDTEDWYNFAASPGQLIDVKLTSPSNVDFKLELYDQYGVKKAGPADIIRYIPSQNEGNNWRIKISTNSGSRQYDFDIRVKEALCAMKTGTGGYFYVPNMETSLLKVEMMFSDSGLVGDQTGGTSPYSSIAWYPDGKIDGKDVFFIAKVYGKSEGEPGWDYMADVNGDGHCDGKDYYIVCKNFGGSGAYIMDLSGVTVAFNTGEEESLDSYGFVAIPQGATSFTVKRYGNPIGAMVIFW
jgi:hypothetical protein